MHAHQWSECGNFMATAVRRETDPNCGNFLLNAGELAALDAKSKPYAGKSRRMHVIQTRRIGQNTK